MGDVARSAFDVWRLPSRVLRRLIACPTSGCWIWTGEVRETNGYGRLRVHENGGRRWITAHVVVWEALVGPLGADDELDHRCRRRTCCNPAHLDVVDRTENNRRRWRAGQKQPRKRGRFA